MEISLGPIVDCEPVNDDTSRYGETLGFGVVDGEAVLQCVCLEPVHAEDLAQGYHTPCSRRLEVIAT